MAVIGWASCSSRAPSWAGGACADRGWRRSSAIGLGGAGRVEELAERLHLAVGNREDVHPVGCHGLAGLLDLHDIAPEHEHLVTHGIEVLGRELREFEVAADEVEELLNAG